MTGCKYSDCKGLTNVTIPNSVTSIGDGAFYSCEGLTNVTIPNSVTSIGESAFEYCVGLTDVTIPNSVTSIGASAFEYCYRLTNVTIPNSVTSIGARAFYGCYKLYEVYNKSDLTITVGSEGNGYVAYYAKNVYTDSEGESKHKTVGDYVFYVDGDNIELLSYTGDETSITLPADYEGKSYKIADRAFYSCDGLTDVTIPNSVTSIGEYAFYSCEGLTDVTIGDGVTSIGASAFYECSGLTNVTIPNSVTSIGEGAFKYCDGLTNVTIPNSVTSIGASAFYSCEGLTDVTIGDGVTSIGESAFWYCKGLTNVTIPNSVTSIGEYAFNSCYGLTNVTIGGGVTLIGDGAFHECYRLTNVTIPNSVSSIGERAFENCDGLTSVTIGDGVTSIGDGAFSYCYGLTNIEVESSNENYTSVDGVLFDKSKATLIKYPARKVGASYSIPEGVTSIGESAFEYCDGLTNVTIPNSVTSIGASAFKYCDGLTNVTIGGGVTSIGASAFQYCYKLYEVYNKSDLTITVGSSGNGYVAYYAKNVYTDSEGESKLKTVGDYVFYVDGDNIELLSYTGDETSITLPADYEGKSYKIADYAFDSCDGLTSVTIPESVTSIGDYVFSGCSGLTNVTIGDGVTSIGEGAFKYCDGLTSVTIGDGATSIGASAFQYCYKLYEVYNKSDLTITVGSEGNGYVAYYAKKVYTDSEGESKLKTVGDYVFYVDGDNIELLSYTGDETSITLPADYEGKIYKIADRAFYNCDGLTSVTIPNSVTSIGDRAFSIISLTSITIPESVTSIGEDVFVECISLTSITIPNSVTSIGDGAFSYCDALTSVTCKNTIPPVIYSETFYKVDKSIPLYVPAESVEAYKSAEGWNEFINILPIQADGNPISEVRADNISVRPIGNNIVVTGTDNYTVYSISGQSLGKVTSVERGIYIVVAEGKSYKVAIK